MRDAAADILSLRGRFGLWFPIVSTMIFGAVLPSVSQALISRKDRVFALRRLPWLMPLWAYRGLEVELFYRLQANIWGTEPGFITVAGKVMTDMFIYNPIMCPEMLLVRWISRRVGELPQNTRIAPPHWYKNIIVPMLVATWALWIPAVTLVYMLPEPLQLPLANLILWLWSMMLIFITGREA